MFYGINKLVYNGKHLSFTSNGNIGDNVSLCTIIIGKNGAGKSRLLSSIAEAYISKESGRKFSNKFRSSLSVTSLFSEGYFRDEAADYLSEINDSLVEREIILPKKLICATSTPYDKFPVEASKYWRNDILPEPDRFYHYLGTRNNIGQISRRSHSTRIMESLVSSSRIGADKRSNLEKIFSFLGLAPEFHIRYSPRIGKANTIELMHMAYDEFEILYKKQGGIGRSFSSKNSEENIKSTYEDLQAVRNYFGTADFEFRYFLDERRFEYSLAELFFSLKRLVSAGIYRVEDYLLRKEGQRRGLFSLDSASSGEQSLLLLFLGIGSAIESDSVILIDEPEISLHPEWQESFIPLLSDIFQNYYRCHFIIATHSPMIISQSAEIPCSVVSLDDYSTTDAKEYFKRSSDFQLAEVFDSPGYRNEYLTRISLTAMEMFNRGETDSELFTDILNSLIKIENSLEPDDPIGVLVKAFLKTYRKRSND